MTSEERYLYDQIVDLFECHFAVDDVTKVIKAYGRDHGIPASRVEGIYRCVLDRVPPDRCNGQ